MKLKCKKCKHKWNYKGKSKWYASCPQCLNKVRVQTEQTEEDKNAN